MVAVILKTQTCNYGLDNEKGRNPLVLNNADKPPIPLHPLERQAHWNSVNLETFVVSKELLSVGSVKAFMGD